MVTSGNERADMLANKAIELKKIFINQIEF